MELCITLVKHVKSLKDDLAQTKKQHAKDISTLTEEIQSLKKEVDDLKKLKSTKLVISSPSSPHDEDSEYLSEDLGNSLKQGRIKTDATFKGRRLNFEQEFADLDDQDDVQEEEEAVGSPEIFAEAVEINKETVERHQDTVDVADVEFQRKRVEKGKVHIF
jgi:predicted RND superfamily exporter protein